MTQREGPAPQREEAPAYRLGNPLFDGTTLGRIVAFDGNHPVIAGTPLIPSQPGCAGDTGTVGENKVTNVVWKHDGLLHVIEGKLRGAEVGDLVLVSRDPNRRERLERTHALVVLVLAKLGSLGIAVSEVEVAAGLGWIETSGPAPPVDLAALTKSGCLLPLSPHPNGMMSVKVGDRRVLTYYAPISQSSLDIGAAEVRTVKGLDDGRETLEVSLANEDGRSWWL